MLPDLRGLGGSPSGGPDPLEGPSHDRRAGGIGKLAELLEMLLDLRGLGGSLAGGPDEKGALYRRLNFDESSDAAEPPFVQGSRSNNNNALGRGEVIRGRDRADCGRSGTLGYEPLCNARSEVETRSAALVTKGSPPATKRSSPATLQSRRRAGMVR